MPENEIYPDTTVEEAYKRFTRVLDRQFKLAKEDPDVPKEEAFTVALKTAAVILDPA